MLARRAPALALLGILALTALAYAPGLSYYFVADDFRYLELAGQTRGPMDVLAGAPGACTRVGWPVVILVFWIARTLAGVQPELYRVISLAAHLANALLVFALVRRLLGARETMPALVGAMVFALHPRQHESVMWLSTITWSFGTMFSLLAAIAYISWRQSGRLAALAAVVAATALAMISNPATIVLPAILAAYDVLRRRVEAAPAVVWAALLVMAATLGLLCGLASLDNSGERASYGLGLSGVSHMGLFFSYVLWPVPLNLKEILAATPLLGYPAIGAVLLVVGLACLAIAWRGTLLARWGLAWAALGLASPAFFSSFTSDHYMSLMLAGVALACAGVVQGLSPRAMRLASVVAVAWLLLALPQVVIKVDDWRTAGVVTVAVRDETLARYQWVADGARFHYIGLPDLLNRSVVWTYGIDSAVRIWYNNPTLQAQKDVQFGVKRTPAPGDLILDFSGRW